MPGDVKTGFTDARAKSILGDDIYSGRIANSVSVMEHDEQTGMPPEKIAKSIYSISVRKNVKPMYTVGVIYKLLLFLQKVLPAGFANRVVAMLYVKNSSLNDGLTAASEYRKSNIKEKRKSRYI
jgi:hypothetical protein